MNIGSLLTKSTQSFPDSLAIVYGKCSWDYAQFNERVNRLANALSTLGIVQGDHVALLMHNEPQMLEAMFACFKMGCAAVPINFRLHPSEYVYIINHCAAKAVICSPQFNKALVAASEQLADVRYMVTTGAAANSLLEYESVLAGGVAHFEDARVDPNDVAWLFYTSGTTGQPKGAMLTHRNLLAMTMNFYADMFPGFGRNEAVLHAAPLSHGSGLYALPNIGKAAANIIFSEKTFEPGLVCKTIQEQRVTNMFAAPTMIKRLVDSTEADCYDLSSLKAVVYGGAPMLVEDLTKAMQKLGPCLVQLYGLGESPMTITYLAHQDHVLDGSDDQMRRLASAGIARTNTQVAIVDDNDRVLGPGERGQIITRSDLVMKGYWRDPQATTQTVKDGWLYTGDVGYLDERGYLFIMDRSKDMIISGGENIYPREIEEVIVQHPAVREVAVIGVPDEQWGEQVKAVVAVVKGIEVTESELIEFCKQHIASFKKPKSVDFVDELPKNNYGKIVKRQLRDKYWQGRQRQVL